MYHYWWPCSSPCVSPFQAPAGCFQQMLLHHNPLWGVQEKEKVRVHKKICLYCQRYFLHFNGCIVIYPFSSHWLQILFPIIHFHCPSSNIVLLFLVQDSTPCPTLPASLMAMYGRCTSSTGNQWKTAVWILVCCSLNALPSLLCRPYFCQINFDIIFDIC